MKADLPGAVRLVVFVAGAQRYALPLAAVERALPMVAVSPLPKAPEIVLGVINLHGRIVPVVDVRRRLGLPSREYGMAGHLLVARTARRALALPTDEVVGVSEVPADAVRRPESVVPGIGHVAGIVALPDGVLLIHDLDTFLSLEEEGRLDEVLAR